VHYCSRACQKAGWPEHKVLCKGYMSAVFDGKQLASTRDFVLEYWTLFLPTGYDTDALVPLSEPLDEAAAFERCRAAAMEEVLPGYSVDGYRLDLHSVAPGVAADIAVHFIHRLCGDAPEALVALLERGGVRPGDFSTVGGGQSLLAAAFTVLGQPYARSAAALPHALATIRLLLARAQPSDWLVQGPGPGGRLLPLFCAAALSDAAVAQAVLDAIVASPGGFPAHAVAASPGILHSALQTSTASFVQALLDAGADIAAVDAPLQDNVTPLHALATSNPHGDARDFSDKLRLLLDAGADLEAELAHYGTPLATAAVYERAAAFDALLAAGAHASALRFNFGPDAAHSETVLHRLALKNDAILIPRILATGVLGVDVRTGAAAHSGTPLHCAASKDAPHAVGALLAGGASLTATTAGGSTALQLAIAGSMAKAARPLVEATPRAQRARYQRQALAAVAARSRDAAAHPGDAAVEASLAAAREIAALLA
jgi:hypothetical protein